MESENRLGNKFRLLTACLIASSALNICLLTVVVFSYLKENQKEFCFALPVEKKVHEDVAIRQMLGQMSKLSFSELAALLTNRDFVEEGYMKRDLAVGVLVSCHHFHLEKALSYLPSQKRIVMVGEEPVQLFPGLNDEQYQAIIRFAYEEKWPLTAEGIFKILKKSGENIDPSLAQAFIVTPEFYTLSVLFQKTEAAVPPSTLVQLIKEGDWALLQNYVQEQQVGLDLSTQKRRTILNQYIEKKSKTAAELLLKTDLSFVVKKLEDQAILHLLDLLDQKTEEAERLCLELLQSPRTDLVYSKAAQLLYQFADEPCPSPMDLKIALNRFLSKEVKQEISKPAPLAVESRAYKEHVVKEGESLWKIARQYKVKPEEIAKVNHMEKDRIYPGMTLKIP